MTSREASGTGANAVRTPTSERLLDTAAQLFWTKGYASTTTREIATLLGVRKASLYHHVARKEDLLFDICVASLENIRTHVEAAVRVSDDPLERVRILIRAHVESMVADQDKHSTMLTELRALSPERRKLIVERRDAYELIVRGILAGAQDAGVLRADIPVKLLALGLLNLLNWTIFWFERSGSLSSERLAEIFEKLFLSGAIAQQERNILPD